MSPRICDTLVFPPAVLVHPPAVQVACALLLVGEKDPSKFRTAKDILVQMGTYFQVQDDFLDCFGDPAVIGKVPPPPISSSVLIT
eukprot:jgi/Mesen1/7423/ME000388S06641